MTRAARQPSAPKASNTPPLYSQHRKDADLEAWICKKLGLRDLFAGTTTTDTRRDRLKVVLTERGLADSHAGSFDGKRISWRQIFTRLYGGSL